MKALELHGISDFLYYRFKNGIEINHIASKKTWNAYIHSSVKLL